MDVTAYGVQVRFQGKMTGWEQMDFSIGQILREGRAPSGPKISSRSPRTVSSGT
ncbi:hypothetical protein [Streptomyces sp. NPDC101234]|uniref:hypothetical protein n=1 Tax=Streptomyces sp. NPDC101234 TaxID=3366138 RepID=UPI00380A60FD